MKKWLAALSLCLAPALASAAIIKGQGGLEIERSGFSKLTGWSNDDHGQALAAFQLSCTKLQALPPASVYGAGVLATKASDWHYACEEASLVSPDDKVGARVFFERVFVPYQLSDKGNKTGKFTGYYEPLLRGSRQAKAGYDYPVYGRPADLGQYSVYPYTRAQIEEGALKSKGLEKLWVNSPIDLFFMQVQGSGRVVLDTGETVALRFDGKTNQPYTAIGKVLIERGALKRENVNAPAIRAWLRDHPADAQSVMHRNQSYVFFKLEQATDEGPRGAQNVPLTPERSLAVDTKYIPLGMPLFLQTNLPQTAYGQGEDYRHLLVAQDKGSAILGVIRGDIFFGSGERAEELAGHMIGNGSLVALVPKKTAISLEGK